MLARALALVDLGPPMFPIKQGAKKPPIREFQARATIDPDEIRSLWTHGIWNGKALAEPAPYNIGIYTGGKLPNGNRMLVVDLDTKEKPAEGDKPGYAAATAKERHAALVAAIGKALPPTLTARTPTVGVHEGRGAHLIFQYADDLEISSVAGLIPGVDIRSANGYIVAPGSHIPGAGEYEWDEISGLGAAKIADAPEELLRFCKARRPSDSPPAIGEGGEVRIDGEADTDAIVARAVEYLKTAEPEAGPGNRHDPLVRIGRRLGDMGLTAELAASLVLEHWPEAPAVTEDIADQFASLWRSRREPIGSRAVENVFEPVEGVDGPAAPAPRTSPRWFFGPDLAEDLRATRCEPLIDGLIDKKTFALILGEPKQGKTHVALSMAAAIARGEPWGGRRTARGLVCYFAGEGGDDVKRRALAIGGGRPASEFPFALLPGQFNVVTPAGVDRLLRDIDGAAKASGLDPVSIFLDTLSRGFGGLNENESAAMGLLVAGVDRIRGRTGANVTTLHHYGKNTTNGARGHSLLRGAYDTCLEVAGRKVSVVEQRAMPLAPATSFQIVTRAVGPNIDGEMVETAVAEIHATAFTEPVALSAASQIALDQFDALAAESPTGVVPGAAWNARLNLTRGGKSVPKATLSGWRKALIEAALIEACGDDLWTRT